jgi:membrane protease YdiL (CAAX protease family)
MADPVNTGESRWLRPELVASWREIVGVLLVLLAPFVVMSGLAAARGSQHRYVQEFISDHALLLNGAAEAGILGLGLVYLHWRGWRPTDLRIRPDVWSSLQGVVLVPLTLFANGVVVFTLFLLAFYHQRGDHSVEAFARFVLASSPDIHHLHVERLSWSVLIVAMILNAFLEEIICTAYAFNQFAAKQGPLFALLLTVLLRMGCHTYQGPIHALGIGAVFFVYGLWYWQTRNVWTLIFAHALLDLGSLSAIKLLVH